MVILKKIKSPTDHGHKGPLSKGQRLYQSLFKFIWQHTSFKHLIAVKKKDRTVDIIFSSLKKYSKFFKVKKMIR